ncbi:MAG: hypothetical protein ACFFCW_46035 [Candidatus Hodarchaeota archaeon]
MAKEERRKKKKNTDVEEILKQLPPPPLEHTYELKMEKRLKRMLERKEEKAE